MFKQLLRSICYVRFVRRTSHHPPRAGDGARTRDIKLGRLALYQLSYSRDCVVHPDEKSPVPSLVRSPRAHGGGRIRTFEGVSRQIYSLLPLAAWVPHPNCGLSVCALVSPPRVPTSQ